jgi:hypothetical protein
VYAAAFFLSSGRRRRPLPPRSRLSRALTASSRKKSPRNGKNHVSLFIYFLFNSIFVDGFEQTVCDSEEENLFEQITRAYCRAQIYLLSIPVRTNASAASFPSRFSPSPSIFARYHCGEAGVMMVLNATFSAPKTKAEYDGNGEISARSQEIFSFFFRAARRSFWLVHLEFYANKGRQRNNKKTRKSLSC